MFEGLVETYGTFGLFISAFISSTIAPGGSEAVLLYLVSNEPKNSLNLVLVATLGNKKYFDKAHNAINRYGSVSLLFSWLPLIGDVLCLAAGWMKLNLFTSLIFITLGKFARYYLLSLTIS